jgi:UDP-N-acetylglucosamine 2-epimerase (non-hydrolysing)
VDLEAASAPSESGERQEVALVLGTRAEAVKLAPVAREMARSSVIKPLIVSTGQHRHMLELTLRAFGIRPDVNFEVHEAGQTPESVVASVLGKLTPFMQQRAPAAVLVQGDTATSLGGALAGFYGGIRVIHLEAGLRSQNPLRPFPEEMHRRLITRVASLHLAPTQTAVDALIDEGVPRTSVHLVGNTVVDALEQAEGAGMAMTAEPRLEALLTSGRPFVLATMHRRESWGLPTAQVAEALAQIARHVTVVVPMHPGPSSRRPFLHRLGDEPNVILTEPVDYLLSLRLLRACTFVLSDSGGLQEEAATVGTPMLVLREECDRPEGIAARLAQLVGTRTEDVVGAALQSLTSLSSWFDQNGVNPYGDGRTAVRAVRLIEELVTSPKNTATRRCLTGGKQLVQDDGGYNPFIEPNAVDRALI